MTSANVVMYTIYDSKDGDNRVGTHRQNIMCKRDVRDLLKFQPAKNYWIHAWGYDEEEAIWESDKRCRLDKWLKTNKQEL